MINNITLNSADRSLIGATPFPNSEFEARQYIARFIAQYNLPANAEISYDPETHRITVIWRGKENMDVFRDRYPIEFHRDNWLGCPVQKAKFEFDPKEGILVETGYFGRTGWGKDYEDPNFIVQKGIATIHDGSLQIEIRESFERSDLPENHARYDW